MLPIKIEKHDDIILTWDGSFEMRFLMIIDRKNSQQTVRDVQFSYPFLMALEKGFMDCRGVISNAGLSALQKDTIKLFLSGTFIDKCTFIFISNNVGIKFNVRSIKANEYSFEEEYCTEEYFKDHLTNNPNVTSLEEIISRVDKSLLPYITMNFLNFFPEELAYIALVRGGILAYFTSKLPIANAELLKDLRVGHWAVKHIVVNEGVHQHIFVLSPTDKTTMELLVFGKTVKYVNKGLSISEAKNLVRAQRGMSGSQSECVVRSFIQDYILNNSDTFTELLVAYKDGQLPLDSEEVSELVQQYCLERCLTNEKLRTLFALIDRYEEMVAQPDIYPRFPDQKWSMIKTQLQELGIL